MKAPPRVVGDVLLAVFAVLVLGASVVVVHRQNAPLPVSTLTQGSETQVQPGRSSSSQTPALPNEAILSSSPRPSRGLATVVVAGPDLAQLVDQLAKTSGDTVVVAESDGQQVLAAGALDAIEETPAAVVLEVLAGTKTSVRTTDAVTAVRARWPAVKIVVVGPFGADDRKSAGAVKSAADAAHVLFLDPVEQKWRPDASKPAVAPGDFATVAAKVAAALR